MADVKPLRAGIDIPERATPPHLLELLDELRADAEAGVLTAIAVASVIDGECHFTHAYESGEGMTLTGAVHTLALQLTHEQAFDEDE